MWDLIVSVPDHCLSFYLSLSIQQKSSVESTLILTGMVLSFISSNIGIGILTVPRRYFCCGSLLTLLSVFILWFSYYVSGIFAASAFR